jgi:hypothetical protein
MHPSGNPEGSTMALCLATGAVIHRQHVSIVPMTSEAIPRINFLTTGYYTSGDDTPTSLDIFNHTNTAFLPELFTPASSTMAPAQAAPTVIEVNVWAQQHLPRLRK